MKPQIRASQFKSRYSQAIAPSSATVNAIFINSPMMNVIGFAPPGSLRVGKQAQREQAIRHDAHNPPEHRRKHRRPSPQQRGDYASDYCCHQLQGDYAQHFFFFAQRVKLCCGWWNYVNQRDYKVYADTRQTLTHFEMAQCAANTTDVPLRCKQDCRYVSI